MPATHILIVEDDQQQRHVLRTALLAHGLEVTDARSGEEALDELQRKSPNVVLLDLNMPGMGGFEACRAIRAHSQIPIIVVSIKQAERDKVEALSAGADDYIIKPFGIEELVARIRAVKRRCESASFRVLVLEDLEIDLHSHDVKRGDIVAHLTSKEFKLLDFFLSHPNQVLSHRRLLQGVWGPDYGDEVEYLRVLINQLRKKIEPNPADPKYILTEPLSGYRFCLRMGSDAHSNENGP